MEENNSYGRSLIVLGLFFLLYCALIINLYSIQILQSDFFKQLGSRQYNVIMKIHPERALIFDRNDNPVAMNKDSVSAILFPKRIADKEKLFSFLKNHFPQAYERLELYTHKDFMRIKRKLSEEEIELIEEANIPDINLLKESTRFYPYESLSTIVGTTDIENNGNLGIEHQFNDQLQGSATTYSLKKDAKSNHFYFSQEKKENGIQPTPIKLTIDAELQYKCQNILNERVKEVDASEAAAIILDPETGEILTSISYPTFNPNDLSTLSIDNTKNRPFTECFESGSVIKVFSALAALEKGVVETDEIIDCENKKEMKLDGVRIRTVSPHGKLPFKDVIKFSNNIGTAKVAKRLGSELYDFYKNFGFGEFTGVNIIGENKGFVNPPNKWSAYSIQSLSFGYELNNNLLQLARAFSIIVNGGYLISPSIFFENKNKEKKYIIKKESTESMKDILEETIKTGTAKRARISGYKTFGKTGTANMLVNGIYDEKKHLYSFVGAVEYNDYKRVIAVYVRGSKKLSYASVIAAPLFKKIAETTLLHDKMLKFEDVTNDENQAATDK